MVSVFLVPGQGFEPQFLGPEPSVLPLDDPGLETSDGQKDIINTFFSQSISFLLSRLYLTCLLSFVDKTVKIR
jgi:hypothetical protein